MVSAAEPPAAMPDASPSDPATEADVAMTNGDHALPSGQPLPAYLQRFHDRVQADPLDVDAWTALLSELCSSHAEDRADDIRFLFDRLLTHLPYSVRHWIMAIEFEARHKDHSRISALFAKSLRSVKSFELFKAYLNYIRRTQALAEDAQQGRAIIKQAYDFVLTNVAHDREAGGVFADYLSFLKAVQVNSAFEEQQKNEEIRKIYQRAVGLPLHNVEQLWREWDAFENGTAKMTAKKVLSERSGAYLTARNALRTLKSLYDGVDRTMPLVSSPTFDAHEHSRLEKWRRIVAWERSNPLKLEDLAQLYARVSWTYWQAINNMSRFPELWYEFAQWAAHNSKPNDVVAFLKAGCDVCPGSFLLHFALADHYEAKDDVDKCKAVYESLITHYTAKVDQLLEIQQQDSATVDDSDPEKELRAAKLALSQCYITYMRSAVRRPTTGIKDMRAIFKRARNMKYATWHVIAASAQLEFHRNADATVAKKLFALAINAFPQEVGPLLVFADWLLGQRDETNLTSTLVTAMKGASLPDPARRRVAEKLHSVYSITADLATLAQHERDMAALLGNQQQQSDAMVRLQLENARRRYAFLDLDLVSRYDLGIPAGPTAAATALSFLPGLGLAGGLGGLAEDALIGLNLPITAAAAGASESASATARATAAIAEAASGNSAQQRRRILDEWVPPATMPVPDTQSGRGWSMFRPGKMSDEEERAAQERARAVAAYAAKCVAEERGNSASVPAAPIHPSRHSPPPPSAGGPPPPVTSVPQSIAGPTMAPVTTYEVRNPVDVVTSLIRQLPPRDSFTGPFFDVLGVLSLVEGLPLRVHATGVILDKDQLPPPATRESSARSSSREPPAASAQMPMDPRDPRRRKRRDDDVGSGGPPKRYRG